MLKTTYKFNLILLFLMQNSFFSQCGIPTLKYFPHTEYIRIHSGCKQSSLLVHHERGIYNNGLIRSVFASTNATVLSIFLTLTWCQSQVESERSGQENQNVFKTCVRCNFCNFWWVWGILNVEALARYLHPLPLPFYTYIHMTHSIFRCF